MPRVLFVVNPTAGRGRTARMWAGIRPQLPSSWSWDEATTERPGHATSLAATAAAQGYDAVFAVGGDGTVREVAAGLLGTGVPLGLVPTGTGSDFARSLGFPRPLPAYLRTLPRLAPSPVDVGMAGEHLYLNVFGIGFDAEVAYRVNARRLTGARGGGTLPYLLTVLRLLSSYRPPEMEVEVDGQRLRERLFMVAVANGPYYAGGMHIAPGASVDDGHLDVILIGELSRGEAYRMVPGMYWGKHLSHPKVRRIRARHVRVSANPPLRAHADGEDAGTTDVTVRCLPRSLPVLRPPLPG